MSENKDVQKQIESGDKELDDLLDSALQDMTKKTETQKTETNIATNTSGEENAPQTIWNEEFIKEAAAQFESNMAALLGTVSGVSEDQITQEQIAQTFSKMAEAAAQVMKPPADAAAVTGDTPAADPALNEVTAAIAQTLQGLNSGADNLQTPFSDEDLANMFSSFNLDGNGQENGANMFVPFMQGMMQSLLSKEVLYPSLKELVDRYPEWLEQNKSKLETSEYDRFTNQKNLMLKVCTELESEQETDSEEIKQSRFQTVLTLMQQMQDLGQPPVELVGDVAAVQQVAPTQDGQCSVM